MATAHEAEAILIENLRLRHTDLATLLNDCSTHWGFEDPIYRFYHQSYKVYALQGQTTRIVEALRALVPERPLSEWFKTIVAEGTGRTLTTQANREWLRETRPIVEAFFHARYFLEMAVRYAELEEPPEILPSGYAALLYLYRLRC